MFIYVSKKSLERPAVKEFVRFYMRNTGDLATEVGYVRLSDREYEGNLTAIQ